MAFIRKSLVRETSTVTGTGAVALGGARSPGRTFSSVMANGDTTEYCISHLTLNEWEIGVGTWNTGNTLTRTSVLESSNANAAVTFSAGTKNVDMIVSSTEYNTFDASATTSVSGQVALASTTDVLTGTDASKAVTSDAVAALWEKGADNTGGATITLGDGYRHDLITSTTTITALAFTTDKVGRMALLRFTTSRQVTHNATSLISPTGANIAFQLGDYMLVESLGSGNFRIVDFWFTDVVMNLPGIVATTTSSSLITAATTNIDCVSFTLPANSLRIGSVYRLSAYLAFSHQAAATPTITTALVIGGSEVLTAATTPPSVLTTLGINAEAIFTCRSTGSSGTVNSFVAGWMGGATGATQGGANSQDNSTTTVNTTTTQTIILRVRMTTGVASNTLRCNQAFIQKIN